DGAHGQQDEDDNDGGVAQLPVKNGVDVVDVDAGADYPVPAGEVLGILQLGQLHGTARPGRRGLREAALVERRLNQCTDRVAAGLVLAVPVILADVFRTHRVHDAGPLAVIDIEKLV